MRRLVLWLAFLILPSAALARSWEIQDFDVDILVYQDGAIRVEERLTLEFKGGWNGIVRSIPVQYVSEVGTAFKLRLTVEGVTDEAGQPLKVEASRRGFYRDLKIWIPGAQDATRMVVIRYRVDNAIRYFPDHDELYWNATGNEWPVPIRRASSIVRLPEAASGSVRALAYTGPFGARGQGYTARIEGPTVVFATTTPLGYREGLTIAVGWAKGVVREPSWLRRVGWLVGANPFLALPLFALTLMGLLWYAGGRDPRPERSVMPLYEPPDGLRPAEVGALLDYRMDPRDLSATLVDLAVRGYLKIEEMNGSYAFRLLKAREAWGELKPYEQTILQGIFEEAVSGAVHLSWLENRFYTRLPEVTKQLYQELKSCRYFTRRPDRVKKFYQGMASALLFLGLVPILSLASIKGWNPLWAVGSLLTAAGVIFGFAPMMPAWTKAGVGAYLKTLGLQEYLARAEKDRMRLVSDPSQFEKLLPYAMALGVERNWARAFAGVVTSPPTWYEGSPGRPFDPGGFSARLGSMSQSVWTAFTSAPRASSSSVFSGGGGGGGSSGGGFGGGGGSAF